MGIADITAHYFIKISGVLSDPGPFDISRLIRDLTTACRSMIILETMLLLKSDLIQHKYNIIILNPYIFLSEVLKKILVNMEE